jgi:hypothetical protein
MLTKIILAVLLVIILIAGGAILLFHYGENRVSTYSTYAEAEREGAISRGWIPGFVPASATDIREVHNLDTNNQWLRFRLTRSVALEMTGSLQPVVDLDEVRPVSSPPRWSGPWPHERDLQEQGEIELYRYGLPGSGARCIAIDWSENLVTVFAWSCLSQSSSMTFRKMGAPNPALYADETPYGLASLMLTVSVACPSVRVAFRG